MLDFLTAKITRNELNPFIEKHQSKKKTLDIGCANSPYLHYFPNRTGLDIEKGNGVDVVGDAHELPFEDGEFEVVLCTEVLEHLHTPEKAISEMERVLKPGGKLILTTRFIFPIHEAPHDYFRYTKYGLAHLFRNWDIVELREEVDTMKTVAVLFQRIAHQTTIKLNLLSKLSLFVVAKIVSKTSSLIVKEYGDIQKSTEIESVLSSGYYLICKKK